MARRMQLIGTMRARVVTVPWPTHRLPCRAKRSAVPAGARVDSTHGWFNADDDADAGAGTDAGAAGAAGCDAAVDADVRNY